MTGGDPFRRVQPGQPLQIPAAAYNAFLDAAAAAERNQQTGVRSGGPEQRSSTLIRIRNESDRDLKQFEVLGIDAPIFDPQASLDAFRREVTFRGVLPDEQLHSGRFVVLQEPVPRFGVGLAVVVGLTIARLYDPVDGPAGDYADVRQSQVNSVRRRSKPIAPIVWADDVLDAGQLRWVVLHLNPQPVRPTTTTTTCSPSVGYCLYEAEFDPEHPEVTRWSLLLDNQRQPIDRCTHNNSCVPPTPVPTVDQATAKEQRRTCCAASTTSTTTTPVPCSGSCTWLWNATSKTWTVQTSNCDSTCACDAPGFCGEASGETTRTDCISGGAPQPPYCGGTTTTCPPATTSPNGGCGTGCTYYYRFGAWHLIENHCTGPQCSCCPPVGVPAGDPECQTLNTACCFPPPPPPPPPPPACDGSCDWVWEPTKHVWVRLSGNCSSGIPGGCSCAAPNYAGQNCSTRATTRCAPPPGGSTTTFDPCGPPPTTSTGKPNSCEGFCRWKWNGALWVLQSSTCADFCPCDAPPGFPGTVNGQVQLVRCTEGKSCCDQFGDEWDLPVQGLGLCRSEIHQTLHMVKIGPGCWQWSNIFDCGDFAQLTVCCSGSGNIQASFNVPCAVPSAGPCTVSSVDCSKTPPTFLFQCYSADVSKCKCCDQGPTTTTTTGNPTTTSPSVPTSTSTSSTSTSSTSTTTSSTSTTTTTPAPTTTTYNPPPPPTTTTAAPTTTSTTGGPGTSSTSTSTSTSSTTSTSTSTTSSTTTSTTTSSTTTSTTTTTPAPTTTTFNPPPPPTTTTAAPTTTSTTSGPGTTSTTTSTTTTSTSTTTTTKSPTTSSSSSTSTTSTSTSSTTTSTSTTSTSSTTTTTTKAPTTSSTSSTSTSSTSTSTSTATPSTSTTWMLGPP